MYLFLDSNIFFNNWNINNPNFQYLFNYINNSGHTLLLSKIVIEETENNRSKQIDKINTDLQRVSKEYNKLCKNHFDYNKHKIQYNDYNFLNLIKDKAENVCIIDYSSLPHEEIVQRALIVKKPFLSGEKGYRDTLIWLSLLDYLTKNKIKSDIIFITENTSDFFKKKNDTYTLHEDLVSDIQSKGIDNNIKPFNSVYAFIEQYIDKNHHDLDYNKLHESIAGDIVDRALEHLENAKSIDISYKKESIRFHTTIREILSIEVDLREGLEDTEINQISKFNNNESYIGYSYNLRRIWVQIEISKSNYLLNKEKFDEIFYEISDMDDLVVMSSVIRAYFTVSFIYNKTEDRLIDFHVENMIIDI